jgi:hypothetical protein
MSWASQLTVIAILASGCTQPCPTGEVTLTFVEQLDEPRCAPIAPVRVPIRDGRLQVEESTERETDAGGCVLLQHGYAIEALDGGVTRTVQIHGVFDWSNEEAEITACQTSLEPPGPRCCGLYRIHVAY